MLFCQNSYFVLRVTRDQTMYTCFDSPGSIFRSGCNGFQQFSTKSMLVYHFSQNRNNFENSTKNFCSIVDQPVIRFREHPLNTENHNFKMSFISG